MKLETIAENNSNRDIIISVDDVYINNWAVSGFWDLSSENKVKSGGKSKMSLVCDLDNADVSTYSEVREIKLSIKIRDASTYETIVQTEQTIELQK